MHRSVQKKKETVPLAPAQAPWSDKEKKVSAIVFLKLKVEIKRQSGQDIYNIFTILL